LHLLRRPARVGIQIPALIVKGPDRIVTGAIPAR
jgi:hypothetical protein